jgi:hypothetical protein
MSPKGALTGVVLGLVLSSVAVAAVPAPNPAGSLSVGDVTLQLGAPKEEVLALLSAYEVVPMGIDDAYTVVDPGKKGSKLVGGVWFDQERLNSVMGHHGDYRSPDLKALGDELFALVKTLTAGEAASLEVTTRSSDEGREHYDFVEISAGERKVSIAVTENGMSLQEILEPPPAGSDSGVAPGRER